MADLELFAPLVSTQWLADHLGADSLVVLDATVIGVPAEQGFTWLSGLDRHLIDGHVPGAGFADLLEEFSDPAGAFGFARPDAERFERAARELGVDDGSTVVVYDSALGQWAARLRWLFRSFGFERVAVLDGGFAAWRAEERPIDLGHAPARAAGPLTLEPQEERWADLAEVERISRGEDAGSLVCALPTSDFTGETGARSRRGRIPGSVSVPLGSVVDRASGTLKSGGELEAAIAPAGTSGRIVVYCGSGIAAAGTALALELAGAENVAIYDGSLNEWVHDPARPVETAA